MVVRRVDLANWALRASPKFTTVVVKSQFHQGFGPDPTSGSPNHPLSLIIISVIISFIIIIIIICNELDSSILAS